jgi:hypothetical protein
MSFLNDSKMNRVERLKEIYELMKGCYTGENAVRTTN